MLTAADLLAAQGIAAQVVNIHTIKPIDTEFIESIASSHGKIVTVEDHGISGGLGSTVAEAVAELGRGRAPARRRNRVRRIRGCRGTLRQVRTVGRAHQRSGRGVDGLATFQWPQISAG